MMRQETKLVIIMCVCILFTSISPSIAASDSGIKEKITLEEAKELAQNSRTFQQYQLNIETAKYKWYQSKEAYQDAKNDSYYVLLNEYMVLQNAEGDNSARLATLEKEMDAAKERMSSRSAQLDSLSDNRRDAEDSYEDSKEDLEKYKQQLDYFVEELYITILNQEDSLKKLEKEYDLKFKLLNIQRKKLEIGTSTQAEVDSLAIETSNLNKTIIDTKNIIKTLKGELNDMLGRDYAANLVLEHFSVPEATLVPTYNDLYTQVSREYDEFARLEREIEQKKDDLDDDNVADEDYASDLLEIQIKETEMDLEEAKVKFKERINNLLADLKLKQKSYQLAKIDLNSSEKEYIWEQKRYELGKISKVDLLQCELNFLNIQNDYTQAGYDFYLIQNKVKLAKQGILL